MSLPRPPVPRLLSAELADLEARLGTGPLTLQTVVEVLGGRGYMLLLILLALPFTQPIPLLGLSTPLGLAIALIAARLALGQRPWLPRSLRERALPAGFFEKVFRFARRTVSVLEKLLRPRLSWLCEGPWWPRIHAVAICFAGLILLLPVFVPFSNMFPAWVVLFIAAGLLERDGGFVLAGYASLAAGVVFFLFLGEKAVALWQHFFPGAGG